MKLLVVEDDSVIADQIARGLEAVGHELAHARSGKEALCKATEISFDAIILDRMLPDITGIAVLERLRQNGSLEPVLILSALGTVEDRVEGLEAGADDYLVKPFELTELNARLQTIARRAGKREEAADFQVGRLRLDSAGHQALFGDRSIMLNRKQFSLLAYLMRHADRLVTRRMLMEHVWGYGFEPMTNIVESNLSRLRTRLLEIDCDPVETRRGSGYILRTDRCQ